MKTTATAFIFYNDKLLLINHKKLGRWLPVGGHSEDNETPKDTVIREVKEEVNLDVEFLEYYNYFKEISKDVQIQPKPFYIFTQKNKINYDFLCKTNNTDNLRIQKDEINDYKWISKENINDLEEPIRTLVKEAFKKHNETE
ncbi:NUDIX hydrolase [Candidatus Woesearchaeota archaeon]|nr:NUDIX hydrolase [Candidatus Woesearchaeota archaeon]